MFAADLLASGDVPDEMGLQEDEAQEDEVPTGCRCACLALRSLCSPQLRVHRDGCVAEAYARDASS